MNVSNNLEEIDRKLCYETYDNFKNYMIMKLIDLKILKLNGFKLIPSMGV